HEMRALARKIMQRHIAYCCIQSTRCNSTRRRRGTRRSMPSSNNVNSVTPIAPPLAGPAKRPVVEPLIRQPEAMAVIPQQFHLIARAIAEDKDFARQRLPLQ